MPLITSHPPFPGHTTPLGSQCSVNSRVMCVCVRVCVSEREREGTLVCVRVYTCIPGRAVAANKVLSCWPYPWCNCSAYTCLG